MTHYVFLKLKNREHLVEETTSTLEKAKKVIAGFDSFRVLTQEESVEQLINMLVTLNFADKDVLKVYLAHDLHTEFLQQLKPDIIEKAIFDDWE